MSIAEPTLEECAKGYRKYSLNFYFDAYIRAMRGEPDFLELEVD